ncbi:hypothetical protein RQP46_000489 [Phenoliferia psychrophenolica]
MAAEPTTAPSPPDSPTIQPSPGEQGDVIDLEQRQSEKRKRPGRQRKKKKGTGFEVGRTEPALHEEDKDRYDPTLPFDQRLLRCIDEWRSLRSLHFDWKITFESVLFHFRADVMSLRQKYGRQALRGFLPEFPAPAKEEKAAGESEDEGEGEGEQPEAEVFVLDSNDEEGWGAKTLGLEAIARWLDDRSNDDTPTLTIAPTLLSNFLGFMLERNVFPKLTSKIEAAVPIADLAKAQLASSAALLKLLKNDQLQTALATIFPTTTSTLASPIPDHSPAAALSETVIPELLTAADILQDYSEADLEQDAVPLGEEGWDVPTDVGAARTPADEGKSPEDTTADEARKDRMKQAQAIKKELEEHAKSIEAWKLPKTSREEATRAVKAAFAACTIDVEREGVWRVVTEERSARSAVGWEKVDMKLGPRPAQAPVVASDSLEPPTATEAPTGPVQLYRLTLGPHNDDFPLTTSFSSAPAPTDSGGATLPAHSLYTPLSILIPESCLKLLVRGIVFEADYTQVQFSSAFDPGPGSASQRRAAEEAWRRANEFFVLKEIYRILPSYYRHTGPEYMRDEPGRQLSFESGAWGPPVEEKKADADGEGDAEPSLGLWPPMRQPSRLDVAQMVDAGEARSPQSFTGIRGRSKNRRGRGGRRGGKAGGGEKEREEGGGSARIVEIVGEE